MRSLLLSPSILFVSLQLAGTVEAQSPTKGILLSREEIAELPASGAAWNYLKSKADASWTTPDLDDQDDEDNVRVLARALVGVRVGLGTTAGAAYRDSVIKSCMACIGTEGGRTLALGRELGAYVIAADLVGLPSDKEATFKSYLSSVRRKELDGKTLISTHEDRPNNWGTICGFTRIAIAAYLNDTADLARAAKVFKGYLGDRASYSGFDYGDLDWQSHPSTPRGINPVGATISGHNVDGGLPEELRRAGGFTWPPPKENYIYTGLEGALLQAWILERFGYPDVWTWESSALKRAFVWLHAICNFPAEGNDVWQPWVINQVYGTTYPKNETPADLSRAIIGADWWAAAHTAGGVPGGDISFDETFSFHYHAGPPAYWTCHSDSDDDTVDGLGPSPADAIRDWLAKNPGQPTP
jgi:hypothetical protein